jgi:hypothetical protein
MTTEVYKSLTVAGVIIEWLKNDSEGAMMVTVRSGDADLNPDELREVIAAFQQALNEVDPPKFAKGGFVMPVASVDPELLKTARKVQ